MTLDPARVERLSALVTECGPLLGSPAGMDAVQRLLSDRGVSVRGIVLSCPSRGVERQRHAELVDSLLDAVDQVVSPNFGGA
ncbi:hypothetical protein QF037_000002 [Streptomyces canus]|uniref:hypothetical protein n=1 Tax=Streptomyces canus TaxID=58343 RepID=UPI00277F2C59|nr:hypothetical protein [Streptomyces canus]MDQ0595657.1 hypothetical protein [Streptomyces canus]